MEKDIVVKIDEILNFFMKSSGGGGGGQSPAIQSELSMLYSKVNQQVKKIKELTSGENPKKIVKKAVEIVIKKEGLNKNWSKLLKQYVKQYA